MAKKKTMKEALISFTTLKLAKEKEIDFWKERFGPMRSMTMSMHANTYYCYVTQALLQRYLREKFHINIAINAVGETKYNWIVQSWSTGTQLYSYGEGGLDLSYEEALEKGLQEALNLIKN